jgi:hypothetical protein
MAAVHVTRAALGSIASKSVFCLSDRTAGQDHPLCASDLDYLYDITLCPKPTLLAMLTSLPGEELGGKSAPAPPRAPASPSLYL